MVLMEQRYLAQTRTITKQYGPKIEAILSGLLLMAGGVILAVVNII